METELYSSSQEDENTTKGESFISTFLKRERYWHHLSNTTRAAAREAASLLLLHIHLDKWILLTRGKGRRGRRRATLRRERRALRTQTLTTNEALTFWAASTAPTTRRSKDESANVRPKELLPHKMLFVGKKHFPKALKTTKFEIYRQELIEDCLRCFYLPSYGKWASLYRTPIINASL